MKQSRTQISFDVDSNHFNSRKYSTRFIDGKDRYNIIGTELSGLVQTRTFLTRALPFDVSEHHTGSGRIWDIHNSYTPGYENTHFVSSKTEPGFMDSPFSPEAIFPRCNEIHVYLHALVDTYDLKKYVYFSSKVDKIDPKMVSVGNQKSLHSTYNASTDLIRGYVI